MKHALALITSLLLLNIAGCGYSFQGSGSILPQDVKTVAIPIAENDTTSPALGQRFTEALRSRFDRYGVVRVIESEGEADAVLDAKILKLENKIRETTSKTDIALESSLVMTVSAELRRRNGQILYRNANLSASDTIAGVGDVVVTSSSGFAQSGIDSGTLGSLGAREVQRGQQSEALENLLDEAAQKIYLEAVAADF